MSDAGWNAADFIFPLVRQREGFAGTASFVSPEGHFLTAAHVLEAAHFALAPLGGGAYETTPIETIAVHPKADVALGRARLARGVGSLSHFSILSGGVLMGYNVYSFGFTGISDDPSRQRDFLFQHRYRKGYIQAFRRFDVGKGQHEVFEVSFDVLRGMSGSPLLITHDGVVLIGVLFGSHRGEQIEDHVEEISKVGEKTIFQSKRIDVTGVASTPTSLLELEELRNVATILPPLTGPPVMS